MKSPQCLLIIYTFKDEVPKKLGDPVILTIPCSIKKNYVKTALCDLGASVMPFSLYRRLDLNKLTPTEISLQMADKSTTILSVSVRMCPLLLLMLLF